MENRPIKFRAWDKVKERMVSINNWLVAYLDEDYGTYEILQFTGLKDKNGTEIYHKDIVKYGEWKYVVAWDNETASFILEPVEGHIGDYFEFENNTAMRVIGNRFENPELLETE